MPGHDQPDHEGMFPAGKQRTSKKLRLQSGYCEYKRKALLIKVGFYDAFVWSLNTNKVCEVAAMANFTLQKNTLPWWYVFVTVGRFFCHACTSMTDLWQNQDSHTCAIVEVFHDITKIIITEVCTSMTINRASQKCFRQGWPTRGIHRNGTLLSYRVGFWIR